MADPFSFALATVAQIGISYLFPSEGPRLKDLKISASTYGAAIPWVFGQTRVPGNMIWSLPIKEHKKKKFAGKGGFANQYTYSCTFAMGLCRGPIKQVRKVWADGKLMYDVTAGITSNSKFRMRFYLGDETQVPDSAIAADLGDNVVPFRGLAYIVFDAIPLADFGNRIPQITAEVLVGASEATVEASQITEVNGTTPIATTFAAGEAAFDLSRRLGYLRDGTTLRQFSLKTGFAVQDITTMGFDGGDSLTGVLTAGHDGAVYVTRGAAGTTTKLDRLDSFSLQSVASATAPTPTVAACAQDSSSAEYLLTISATGEAALFKALDLTPRWTVPLGGTANLGPTIRLCGRDADASGAPSFCAFMLQPGLSGAVLAKVQGSDPAGPTIDELHTITGDVQPRAVLWDSAGSAAILFWMDGTDAFVAKWSEDVGAEVWRTPITGCPTLFSGQSRLLSDQLGWVYNGRLYVINTITGEMIEKDVDPVSGDYVDPNLQQVDWADYLTRYPDVKAEYFVSGWTVAASPEAYAEWHYQNFGLYEGRTLTYIGGGQGGGFALTGPFAGLSATYQAYDSTRGLLICLNGLDALVNLTDVANGVSVGTIVARLLAEGGVPTAMTDLQPLFQMPIRGYGWASGTDIKNIIDELRRLYLFDLVERDGVIVAISRGDPTNGLPAANEVIKQGALGSSSSDAVDFWQETRLQEADIPAQVTLAYMNIEADFEASTARSARISNPIPTMFSRQQLAMEINVVLTPAEAKAQVNKILYAQWLERTQHTTRLPWAYLNLDPADVVEVHMDDGRVYQDRIHHTEIGADFAIAVESFSADEGAYDLPAVAADGGSATGQTVADVGVALPFVINTPLLRDQDDQGGSVSLYYLGIGNAADGKFLGAGLYRSLDNIDYDNIASRESDVEWGTVLGVTPSPAMGAFALDWKTRITINPAVDWFDLEAITDDDLWNGANACLVGDEVLQFRDCVKNADGTWTIWNLMRGRRATEYACDTHGAGERFIFLSNATIATAGDLTTADGLPRYFKAVGAGQTVQEAAVKTITYHPRDLMPYAPADIRRDFDTGGITVTWQRRTRLGGNLQDGTGAVSLVEKFEKYEAYVLAAPFAGDLSVGAAPASFRRKYEVTTPSLTYSAAEQAADGFNPLTDDLHVVIYQLSDAVGRGFPGVRSIPVSDIL